MPSFSKLLSFAVPLVAVAAAPLGARQVTPTDLLVFQFANVLEKLERDFYEKAIAKFTPEDFATAGYESTEVAAEQLGQILRDETAHQTALESALASFGQQPLPGCTFALDSVLTDVTTTMTVARLVEVTGVGAYLGAAALLSDPRLLTSAASILTIEARHGTMLNALNGGATVPQAFDIPLAPEQVLAIAGGFIQGCDLGVKANPSLTITPEGGRVGPDTLLTFQSPGIDAAAGQPLFCQMVVGGATMSVSLPIENCRVPSGIIGPVAIFITNDEQPLLASDIVDQSKFNVVAGPNFVFVDFGTPQQKISRLILTPQSPLNKDLAGTPPSNENTVNTITPPEASSSIAAAGAQSTPAPAAGGAGASPAVNTVFQGDILVKMPPVGGEEAPAPTDALGSAGLPLPSVPVGSDGLPLPTGGPVDPALDPAAGGAAGAPIVPIAGDAAASGIALPADPLATGAPAGGDISISIGRRHRFMRRMD